jgi:hypothetical protein
VPPLDLRTVKEEWRGGLATVVAEVNRGRPTVALTGGETDGGRGRTKGSRQPYIGTQLEACGHNWSGRLTHDVESTLWWATTAHATGEEGVSGWCGRAS